MKNKNNDGIKKFFTLFLILFCSTVFAQTTDLARVEYLNIPFSKSDNSIQRYRALVQAPIPLDKENNSIFVISLEYRYIDFSIKDTDDQLAFGDNLVDSSQDMRLNLGYTWKFNKDWRFGVRAGARINSTLENSIESDDLVYEGGIYAILDKKDDSTATKPYRLILGLTYSTTPGRNYPLPLINYFREFRPNWTFTLGVPKTNIRHYLNDSHKDAIQAFATLDNIYANLQNNFVPMSSQNPNNKQVENIEHTIGLLGLGYEHFFTDHLLFYGYAAHSVYNNFRMENNDGDKIYEINSTNTPYFRAGLKFKY
ncbi:DUF6268 family outer membrane beta-barrel protein [Marixanthomonas ophiurae]|uniref:DUF6268 family outer membrane beta-barrel protein n=1 Tax=Marixanthomonas ophiurae TaxID=387659 RepID=UPI001EFCD1AA|nr:DUF6268 family outer membrane beta-barrel protein [Marixanthomonas ophiurae]